MFHKNVAFTGSELEYFLWSTFIFRGSNDLLKTVPVVLLYFDNNPLQSVTEVGVHGYQHVQSCQEMLCQASTISISSLFVGLPAYSFVFRNWK